MSALKHLLGYEREKKLAYIKRLARLVALSRLTRGVV